MEVRKTAVLDSRPTSAGGSSDGQIILPDSVAARKAEIHFCYTFTTAEEVSTLLKSPTINVQDIEVEMILGNDGHLLFHKPLVCVELKKVPSFKALANNITTSTPVPLSIKVNGQDFNIGQVFLRLYSSNIGILRFAVECSDEVPLQTILDIQNGIMRLSKNPSKQIKDSGGNELISQVFVERILTELIGDKGKNWYADERTDRLAVYTLAGFTSVEGFDFFKAITYKVGQMESSVSSPLDREYLEDFYKKGVYSRYASSGGGIYTTFHVDGGTTLFFAPDEQTKVPVLRSERQTKTACFGSTRPLVAVGIFEPYLFYRAYLRAMDRSLYNLISQGKTNKDALNELKATHLKNLRYKALYLSRDISSTRGGKEQFAMHLDIGQLTTFYSSLSETIDQLYSYYSAVEDQESQSRLDALSLVFSVLGVAGLVLDFYSYYVGLDRESEFYDYHRVIPALVDGLLIFGTMIVIYRMRNSS